MLTSPEAENRAAFNLPISTSPQPACNLYKMSTKVREIAFTHLV